MDYDELKSYKPLFIKSSRELVEKIKQALSTGSDINQIHRFFHNLKGQSFFMNLQEIGDLSLEGEKQIESLIKENKTIEETGKKTLLEFIDKISNELKNYEDNSR